MAKPEFPCLAEHDDLEAAQSEPEFMQVPNAQKLTRVNQKEQGFPIEALSADISIFRAKR